MTNKLKFWQRLSAGIHVLMHRVHAVYETRTGRIRDDKSPFVSPHDALCAEVSPDLRNSIARIYQGYSNPIRFAAVLVLLLCLGVGNVWGAVTPLSLPKTWEATEGKAAYTEALGCTQNGLGSDYSASGTYLKFDNTGDYLIIQLADAPAKLTYNIKSNGFSGGTFKVQQSSDGSSYSDLASYTSITDGKKEHSLNSTTRYIKFIYTTKSSGNVGLGTIGITKKTVAASITLNNYSGSATTTNYYEDDDFTLPSTNSYTCGTKTFVGWSTVEVVATDTKPTSNFYEPGEEVTLGATNTFYAVFADAVEGDPVTQWRKQELSAVTAGTYAIITPDGHAFNGSISSGHGQVTSSAFSFTNNVATSAPSGTCELILTASSSGFTMYNAIHKYLYASAASSGKLAWHDSESSYWKYTSSNWIYNSNSAYLRSYNNGSIRTYASGSNSEIKFVRKETIIPTTYSNYATSCCSQLGSIKGSFLRTGG